MAEPEVRLHDVAVTGDVDRAALLAAIQTAVADASATGAPIAEAVRTAVAAAVTPVPTGAHLARTAARAGDSKAGPRDRARSRATTGGPGHGDSHVV